VAVWGWAWSGEGELTGLDVSTDGGQTWKPARFSGRWDRDSWWKWEYEWGASAGTRTLMARATDSLGRIQLPSRARNPLGYRGDVIHAVKVDVVQMPRSARGWDLARLGRQVILDYLLRHFRDPDGS
jgi:hypothetical protein